MIHVLCQFRRPTCIDLLLEKLTESRYDRAYAGTAPDFGLF